MIVDIIYSYKLKYKYIKKNQHIDLVTVSTSAKLMLNMFFFSQR